MFNNPKEDFPAHDGVNGFQDSEEMHTPLAENVKSHIEKREQNMATIQGDLGAPALIHNYPPPGGRQMTEGTNSKHDGMQVSREGTRSYVGSQTHGKVLIAGNHPNKKLSQIYG